MNTVLEDFQEMLRVSTPFCVVKTSDYRATIVALTKAAKEEDNDKVTATASVWYCTNGVESTVRDSEGTALAEAAWTGGEPPDGECPPYILLGKAITELEPGGILFLVVPSSGLIESPATVQALAALRDPFKATRRMVVILGTDITLSPFIAEDVPVLEDPRPGQEELEKLATKVAFDATGAASPNADKAGQACLGLTLHLAEESLARKLEESGAYNVPALHALKRITIEQSTRKALVYEQETWRFGQIGGMYAFKDFMADLFRGPEAPSIVVRWDEVDKSITSASTGAVADNTGVSQDSLKATLTGLEDNNWMAIMAVGGPGTGKTLSSICTGNEFNVPTLSFDMGAVKGSLVGESEGRIRNVMSVLKAMAGKRVLFIGTANRLDTLPPELQRRFWLGTWFWDLPGQAEREKIWAIQQARYPSVSLKEIETFHKSGFDEEWTGSDIRNACRMAYVCGCSLPVAASRISIAGKTSKDAIASLRKLAEASGFRDATKGGAYKYVPEKAATGRKVNVRSN